MYYERNKKLVEKPFSTGKNIQGNTFLDIFLEMFPIYDVGFLYTTRSGIRALFCATRLQVTKPIELVTNSTLLVICASFNTITIHYHRLT
jgi:hypothetical protein